MKLLTIQEVADTMKISESTIRRLIRGGRIIAFKVGERGQLRVEEKDLERYIESQRIRIENFEAPCCGNMERDK